MRTANEFNKITICILPSKEKGKYCLKQLEHEQYIL